MSAGIFKITIVTKDNGKHELFTTGKNINARYHDKLICKNICQKVSNLKLIWKSLVLTWNQG